MFILFSNKHVDFDQSNQLMYDEHIKSVQEPIRLYDAQ